MENQEQQGQQNPIPSTLNRFGKEYCLQGVFPDKAELEATKERWKSYGHKAMVIKENILYVTRFPQ